MADGVSVAARDEARRARGLGVDTSRALAIGMAVSGGLAGLAGVLYLAAVPAGVAPGAFDPSRSLDVVAFAVVGGLGSAIGAGSGAALLVVAGVLLPPPWGTVATGAGVLWVVLFAPGGLAKVVVWGRDLAARTIRPELTPARPVPPEAPDHGGPLGDDDGPVLVVAGADTREALSTPAIRAAMAGGFLVASPALAALFGVTMVLRDHTGIDAGSFAPWLTLAAGASAAAAAVMRWARRSVPAGSTPAEPIIAAGAAVTLVTFVVSDDPLMLGLLCIAGPAAGGWVLAGLARTAADVCVPRTRSAGAGVVAAAGVAGLAGAVHLAALASGNTILEAARWAALYLAAGCIAAGVASARAGTDRRRTRERLAVPAAVGRRRWAPLRVESVTVDFGAHRVLDGVSLEVRSSEVVALVGTNGAGKSTLLHAVAGFTPVTAGRVDVAGEEITTLRPDERAAAGVAFVSGARPAFPDLTVRENLRVGGYLTHRHRRSFTRALNHVLAAVPALAARLDTRAGLLSGGEQRQLAIAQTLFRRPTLLLADELTLGLDRAAQQTVLELLRALADNGIGVVVVDHDLHALTGIADRVAVIHDGAVVDFDDTAAFREVKDNLLPARYLVGTIR
ncbi:MAG: ATP-binding cassette domain-containing protein [Acidimicrobiales bacterium]